MTPVTRILLGIVLLLAAAPGSARPAPTPFSDTPRQLDLTKHDCPEVNGVWFSPDGKIVVVSGSRPRGKVEESVRTLWDVATGRHLRTYRGDDARFSHSPDWKLHAVIMKQAGVVVIRDAASEKEIRRLKHERVGSAHFSPDGKYLLSSSSHYDRDTMIITSGLQVWDVASGACVFTPRWEKDEYNRWETFTRDGRLVFATSTPRLRVWNPQDGKETLVRFGADMLGTYSTDTAGIRLVYSGNGSVRSLDMTTGKVLHTFGREGDKYRSGWVTPDGSEVVATTEDGRIDVYNAATAERRSSFRVIGEQKEYPPSVYLGPDPNARRLLVDWFAPLPDGKTFARVSAVYTRNGKLVRQDQDVREVTFDPTGRTVAVWSWSATMIGQTPRMGVTLHDAAAWLAGPAKKD